MKFHYYKIFKPHGMISQFTPEAGHDTLGSLFSFPKDVYPVGRLDHDTEGLLLLTDDKRVNARLLHPGEKISKTYWVQVEGTPDEKKLAELRKGMMINLKGTLHKTEVAQARIIRPPDLAERNPPVNYKKHPVTSWVELILTEGKNRQVRKMTAKAGHPALRLIRFAIGKITIEGLLPGDVAELGGKDFHALLGLPA